MTATPLILPFDGHHPVIADSAWVAPTATLIGHVHLGDEASIFYGAVLRADVDSITIGARSNLQDNVTVHCDAGRPAVVGTGVSVGHAAVLHGCVIEDDCLVGMSATVLNDAVVGAGSLIAAGAVVLEGSIIPPGSLVAGVPANVLRALTEEERAQLKDNATRYETLAALHRELA